MKKAKRRALHEIGDHRGCKIRIEKVPDFYDHTTKYIAGPMQITRHADGSIEWHRDVIDVTSMFGDPVYTSGKTKEVHR